MGLGRKNIYQIELSTESITESEREGEGKRARRTRQKQKKQEEAEVLRVRGQKQTDNVEALHVVL